MPPCNLGAILAQVVKEKSVGGMWKAWRDSHALWEMCYSVENRQKGAPSLTGGCGNRGPSILID